VPRIISPVLGISPSSFWMRLRAGADRLAGLTSGLGHLDDRLKQSLSPITDKNIGAVCRRDKDHKQCAVTNDQPCEIARGAAGRRRLKSPSGFSRRPKRFVLESPEGRTMSGVLMALLDAKYLMAPAMLMQTRPCTIQVCFRRFNRGFKPLRGSRHFEPTFPQLVLETCIVLALSKTDVL